MATEHVQHSVLETKGIHRAGRVACSGLAVYTDILGNWKREMDEIQLARAGGNGGLSMLP
jgi:hypothetical protein